jgi:hypothetical protein
MRDVLRSADRPVTAEHMAARIRNRWQALANSPMYVSKTTLDGAKEAAELDAAAFEAAVCAVRALHAAEEARPRS